MPSVAIMPNEGELKFLDMLRAGTGTANVNLVQYVNNVSLAAGTVWADLTEAGYKGYSRISLSGLFGAAAMSGGYAVSACAQQTFAYNSGSGGNASETVYGHAVTFNSGGTNKILYAVSLATPQLMAADGYTIKPTPKFKWKGASGSDATFPDEGLKRLLDMWRAGTTLNTNARESLFKSATTPGSATALGDLTKADFSGYADVTPTFGSPADDSGAAKSVAGAADFTLSSGSQTIHGRYTWDNAGTKLLWLYAVDQALAAAGDKVTVTDNLRLASA